MPEVPVLVPNDAAQARALVAHFIAASRAANTRRSYAGGWRNFEAWCVAHQHLSLPASPETVATYCAAAAAGGGRKFGTIKLRCAAISFVHRNAGHVNPVAHAGVKATLSGIARELGTAPTKKAALTADLLAKAVRKIPVERRASARPGPAEKQEKYSGDYSRPLDLQGFSMADLTGLRDRALLLLGFAGALRRSELVDLNVNDITRHPKGVVLTLGRSKTDQECQGTTKTIPHGKKLRTIEALDAWIRAAGITEGPIFRVVRGSHVLPRRLAARQVARIVKKRATAIGLDPKVFGGHSLRSGYASTAADHGAELASIARQLGHKSLTTTRGYVQVRDAFMDHSGRKFL
jgi:integrase